MNTEKETAENQIDELEISEDNSLSENMRIGQQILEHESEEGNQDDGSDGGNADEDGATEGEGEDTEAKVDGGDESEELDWSKAPPELKKAYRKQLEEAKESKKKLTNATSTVEKLVEKITQIQNDKKPASGEEGEVEGYDPNNPPDRDLDPDGFDDWQRETDRREREADKRERAISQAEQHFEKSVNDIPDDMMEFATGVLKRGLAANHPNATDEQLDKAVNISFLEAAYHAKTKGVSFAEHIQQQARIFGYAPKQAESNGGEKPAPRKKGTGRVNMDKVIENAKDKNSLGDTGGTFRGEKNIDDLLEMDNDDLDTFMKSNKKEFNKILQRNTLEN